MTKTSLMFAAAAAALLSSPVHARPMTATDMHMMHRLGAPEVSPDGRWAVFTISETDLGKNKRNNRLHLLDLRAKGAVPQPIAGADGGHDAAFGPDGALYFLKTAGDYDQLFRMPVGGAAMQISGFQADVSGFKIAPSGDRLIVWADRSLACTDLACTSATSPAKPEGSGRTFDKLFVRHWDTWAEPGTRSRIFGFAIENGRVTGPGVAVTGNLEGDTPSKPFGGGEEIAFSKDGRTVYFALREAGSIEATSTNLDIFAAPTDGSAPPVNLTDANDATDTLPAVSPDGRTLAYVAMARPGYESDRQVVMLRDVASGTVRALTQSWDRSPDSLAWGADGKSLFVTAADTLEEPVFRVDVASGKVTRLTREGHSGNVRPLPNGDLFFTSNSVFAPDDVYRAERRGRVAQLTNVNRDLLAQLDPVTLDRFSFAGANGDKVWGIKVKPVRNRTLPIAFVVHGGPQGSFGNSWSYRWNPRLFASPGYAVVSVDFHGSTGYGQAFTDAIRNDWGGKPLEDLQKGLAFATANDPQLDASRACALGASYGGYMMNWIEGNWPDRFKCLVQHDGVFDARAMAYETEELWFDEWEHGGNAYYEDPQAFERWNPVNFVTRWKTPMLVVTGEKDFRIPYTQGLAAFSALQRRNIPSRLLVFPDENHWVLKPKNSIQWYDEVFGWMGKYLKQ
ncbi:MAG: S9 family peptidase [Sphingomicrobium sp.]